MLEYRGIFAKPFSTEEVSNPANIKLPGYLEIGSEIGRTREHARQLHINALSKLRFVHVMKIIAKKMHLDEEEIGDIRRAFMLELRYVPGRDHRDFTPETLKLFQEVYGTVRMEYVVSSVTQKENEREWLRLVFGLSDDRTISGLTAKNLKVGDKYTATRKAVDGLCYLAGINGHLPIHSDADKEKDVD